MERILASGILLASRVEWSGSCSASKKGRDLAAFSGRKAFSVELSESDITC